MKIWLAPSEGLFLSNLTFNAYNMKGNIPMSLVFDESEKIEIDKFRLIIIE